MSGTYPIEGGCACRSVRYQLKRNPMFVHCCHCRYCQRESGSAFVLNALIEGDEVVSLGAAPLKIDTPSASGDGQIIYRCPECFVAVWSVYSGSTAVILFLRVGTLDNPDLLPPNIDIYTSTKQPWVQLTGLPSFPEFYDMDKLFSDESRARRAVLLPKIIENHRQRAEAAGAQLKSKTAHEENTEADTALAYCIGSRYNKA